MADAPHIVESDSDDVEVPESHAVVDAILVDSSGDEAPASYWTMMHASEMHASAPAPTTTWDFVLARDLRRDQLQNLLQWQAVGLRYADDCSGARAPFVALTLLFEAIMVEHCISVPVDDCFASEDPGRASDGPRRFITDVYDPRVLFRSCHRGRASHAPDFFGTMRPIPEVDVYVAGFVCKDLCSLNPHMRPLLADDSGASTSTLMSSWDYIEVHTPAIVVLENLVRRSIIAELRKLLRRLPDYDGCAFVLNSLKVGVPMTRLRLFVVLVNTRKCLRSMLVASMVFQMCDVAKRIVPVPLADCLDSRQISAPPKTRFPLSSSRCGSQWKKDNAAVRSALVLPGVRELRARTIAHSPAASLLTPCMVDKLGLHYEVALRNNINPSDHHFLWDLSNSIKYSCLKDPKGSGVMPCPLRNHVIWDTLLKRPIGGHELLTVHGFPSGVKAVTGVDNRVLTELAGDTMSIAAIGSILGVVVANTTLSQDAELLDRNRAQFFVRNDLPSCYINSKRSDNHRKLERDLDNLWCLAGFEKPGKATRKRCRRDD